MISYHRPATLAAAMALLARQPDLVVVAGATDIYPARTARAGWGQQGHGDMLDISAVPDLRGIRDRGDHWHIGATTTWSEIIAAPLPPCFDGLKAAAREIGGVQIQNRGTIAGNLCTASPAGDSIPCLLTLDAEVEIIEGTEFRLPITAFFTGYRRTAISGGGALVTGIRVPKQRGHGHFQKLGARHYQVISIAMAAAVIDAAADGRVLAARIAVGACSAVAQRLHALEAALVGQQPDPGLVHPQYLAHLMPIDDIRASADYRRAAALQLVRDLLADLAARQQRAA